MSPRLFPAWIIMLAFLLVMYAYAGYRYIHWTPTPPTVGPAPVEGSVVPPVQQPPVTEPAEPTPARLLETLTGDVLVLVLESTDLGGKDITELEAELAHVHASLGRRLLGGRIWTVGAGGRLRPGRPEPAETPRCLDLGYGGDFRPFDRADYHLAFRAGFAAAAELGRQAPKPFRTVFIWKSGYLPDWDEDEKAAEKQVLAPANAWFGLITYGSSEGGYKRYRQFFPDRFTPMIRSGIAGGQLNLSLRFMLDPSPTGIGP
jgi:hypothetical protein